MGSIGTHRDKGVSNADFFTSEFDNTFEILASASIGSVFYAACRKPGSDEVWALVSRYQWTRDYFNFTYRLDDETVGPCHYDAPAKVLDLLTPTDSKWANEWRQKCRDNIARKAALPKVTKGTIVRFATAMDFTDGVTERDFIFIERSRFRRVCDNSWVSIPRWKDRAFETAATEGTLV